MSPGPEIKKPMPVMTPLRKTIKFIDPAKNLASNKEAGLLGYDLQAKLLTQKAIVKSPAGKIRKFA